MTGPWPSATTKPVTSCWSIQTTLRAAPGRVADDCRYGVVSLGDGRLAYSTEREVVVVDTDG